MQAKKISEVIGALERLAPSGTAEKWDNTGLLAGDPEWLTPGAVVSVDLTADSLDAAEKNGCKLVVTHHPCIFPRGRGPSRLVPGARSGISALVFDALRRGIAVASYHTNFDQCALEVISTVAGRLGVTPRGRLHEGGGAGSLLKLVVFVPESHLDGVRAALSEAGAGHIGLYDYCTFGATGEGTFRGSPETKPFAGQPGVLEKVREVRLETILPKGLKKSVLEALKRAHPYQEVAYDLYVVEQGPAQAGIVKGLGYGFWGEIASPKPFPEFVRSVKDGFATNGFLLTQPAPKHVQKLGFVAGKGAAFVEAAAAAGCDVFITGEVGYHGAVEAARGGMAVLELGHRESEIFFIETMESWLSAMGLKTIGMNTRTQTIVAN